MPTRLIRDGILSSEVVNQLTWAEEVFYRRLLSLADDYGLYDARETILRAHLYPLRLDRVSNRDIQKWHARCEALGLVKVYEVEGRSYGQIAKYGQQSKSAPKHPLPPGANPADYRPPSKKKDASDTERNESLRVVTNRHLDGVGDVVVNKNKLVGSSTVCDKSDAQPAPARTPVVRILQEGGDFATWLKTVGVAHPSVKQSRALASDVLQAAREAFERCPQAAEYAPLLTAYYADTTLKVDSNREKLWRPRGQRLFFENLEDVIFSHAVRWAKEAKWKEGKPCRKASSADTTPQAGRRQAPSQSAEEKAECNSILAEMVDMVNASPYDAKQNEEE